MEVLKMFKDRSELEQNLNSIIIKYNGNKKLSEKIKKDIIQHGYSGGEIQQIWGQSKNLEEIDQALLYLLTKYLYEATNEGIIRFEDYFTETEIRDGNVFKREIINDKLTFPLFFKDVKKGNEDQFITYLSMQKIKQLIDDSVVTYNFDTQRSAAHKINSSGDIIKTINTNKTSIKEISDDLLNEKFIPNCLTFNLLANGYEEFNYDDKKQVLAISKGEINVIDGFHRCMGIIKALNINPNLTENFEVRFTNWNVDRCRQFIYQEDKKNKINTHYIKSIINTSKMGNKVVKLLNEGTSDINGKITSDITLIRKNKCYTMADMLSAAIDLLWDLKTNREVIELSNFLGDFFDVIIDYRKFDFLDNLEESRKSSVVTLPAIFIGYLAVAKQIQNLDNWQDKLYSILDNVNFRIENPIWEKLKIISSSKAPIFTLSKTNYKNIINHFVGLIN